MITRRRGREIQTETKVERVLSLLQRDGQEASRGDIIEMFRRLETLGAGQFVTGRRGWPSRFVWRVGMVSVGKAAAGEPQEIEEIPEEQLQEESTSEMLAHAFYLRTDLPVHVELPSDLTPAEAERLASFIRTLPIEGAD